MSENLSTNTQDEATEQRLKRFVGWYRATTSFCGRFLWFVGVMATLSIAQIYLLRPLWEAHIQMDRLHDHIFAYTQAESNISARSVLASAASFVVLYLASRSLAQYLDLLKEDAAG